MTMLGRTAFQLFHVPFKNELHPVNLIIQTSLHCWYRAILYNFLDINISYLKICNKGSVFLCHVVDLSMGNFSRQYCSESEYIPKAATFMIMA